MIFLGFVYYLSGMPVKKTSPVKKNAAKAPAKKSAPSVYVSAFDLAKEAKEKSRALLAKASEVTGELVEKVEGLLGVAPKKKAPAKKAAAKKSPATKKAVVTKKTAVAKKAPAAKAPAQKATPVKVAKKVIAKAKAPAAKKAATKAPAKKKKV